MRHIFILILACLSLVSCKFETKNLRDSLITQFSGLENLYYHSHRADIEAGINLEEIGREVSQMGYINILKLLANNKANLDQSNESGMNCVLIAAKFNQEACLRFLVEDLGLSIHTKNKNGENALMFATLSKNLQLMQYLIDHGSNPKAKNNFGQSILMYAVATNDLNVVKFYFEDRRAVNLNITDNEGKTALDYAEKTNKSLIGFLNQQQSQ